MNISIRDYIINNFKDSSSEEIKESINDSIKSNDEVVLPGLGVLFEIIWKNCDNENKEYIINLLNTNLK